MRVEKRIDSSLLVLTLTLMYRDNAPLNTHTPNFPSTDSNGQQDSYQINAVKSIFHHFSAVYQTRGGSNVQNSKSGFWFGHMLIAQVHGNETLWEFDPVRETLVSA